MSKGVQYNGGHYLIELDKELDFTTWLFLLTKLVREFELVNITFFDFNHIDLVDDCIPLKEYLGKTDLKYYEGFIHIPNDKKEFENNKNLEIIINETVEKLGLKAKRIEFDF